MPTQLLRLAVRNVSAVDRPANQRTFLTIKAEDAMTFADALMLQRMRDVYEALSERYGALMETMDSIRQSEEPDKLAACHAALDAFAQSVSTDVPALMAVMSRAPDPDDDTNNSVTKAGRKISAARFAKLKTLYTVLGEIMQEGAETMTETTKASVPDMSALTKIGQSLAALFGRAAGAPTAPDPTSVNNFDAAACATAALKISRIRAACSAGSFSVTDFNTAASFAGSRPMLV